MDSRSFLDRLTLFGDSDAVVFNGRTYSYKDLLRAIGDWRHYFLSQQIVAGEVVSVEGRPSLYTCAALVALIERGAIVVPLSPLPPTKRQEFLDLAQTEVVVRAEENGERICERTGSHADHELYDRLRRVGHAGLVLFSSGTSGRSKASVLDFDKALGRYGEARRPQRILSFLNLDHIGGINTLLHTFSQGGTVVTVADRTPDGVFATIAQHRVEVLPTTPTFLNMVLISGVLDRYSTDSLKLITYGTEPMPLQTLQRLKEALPNVRFKQTYGLSELGILPTRSRSDDTLWVKIGGAGFDYKIIDNVLWVRSEMAMLGYLNAPAPFDENGFFNTQDVVETDGDYVRILGRRSEIINVGGEKVYPAEVESVLLELANIAEVTVAGHHNHVTGMVVKATLLLIKDEDERSLRRRIRQHCRDRLEPYKIPAVIEVSTTAQHSDRFKKIRRAV